MPLPCCTINKSNHFRSQKRQDCNKDKTCLWRFGRCVLNRDADNNVCCSSEVHKYCDDIVDGVCPDDFQVGVGWN